MKSKPSKSIALLILAALFFAAPSRAEFYALTVLGTLGGTDGEANDINDSGQIVGKSRDLAGNFQAFVYKNGQMTGLFGLLGGANSEAFAINNGGKIVGTATNAAGRARPFLHDAGVVTEFPTFGGDEGRATGINDNGFISGHSQIAGNARYIAFRIINGIVSPLTMPDLASNSNAINASGETVEYAGSNGTNQAFTFTNGNIVYLGTLGGANSYANGINTSGVIVGSSDTAGGALHAFAYENGAMRNLGHLGGNFSYATDIGPDGTIVGQSMSTGGANVAFVYSNGQMNDLNRLIPPGSGLLLVEAAAINSAGQIVGYGTTAAGDDRAFLLTPDRTPPTISLRGSRRVTTSRPRVRISGSARDNALVAQVDYRGGKAKSGKASGAAQWRLTAPVKPGKNRIVILAKDGAGLFSNPLTVTVTRR